MAVKLTKPTQTRLTAKWSPVSGEGITGYELKFYQDRTDLEDGAEQNVSALHCWQSSRYNSCVA